MENSPEIVVLVVDDDPTKRYLFAHTLRLAGMRVLEAATGQEALGLAEQGPDLILLDVHLPDLSGREVAGRLKARPETRSVVIAHVSAVATGAAHRVAGLEGGADAYFVTPLEPEELVANVRALVRLRREAREAVQVRDDFLAVAAHELRTPLAALELSGQLLGRSLRPGGRPLAAPEVLKVAERIERQAGRLARLVEALLDVSRIRGGRLRLDAEEVDLSALAREAAGRWAEAGPEPLSAQVQPGVTVQGDPLRLDEVLSNLLSNARKYGGGRPVNLALAARGGRAVLTVRDQGIGIEPEHQQRIFERFERATPQRAQDSLGLGLFIVRELVLAHGGAIAVESQPGRGTTFTVELPLRRPASTLQTEEGHR